MSRKNRKIRNDGYLNSVIGHGLRSRDPFTAYKFMKSAADRMSQEEAEELFTYNGVANKIITAPANEAVRAGFTLMNGEVTLEQNELVKSIYEDLNGDAVFSTALAWDRLYGGGAILMMIDDGANRLDEPVNENNIRDIERLEVYDAKDIDRNEIIFGEDPNDPGYGYPETYQIIGYNGNSFRVHKSRLLVFEGGLVSNRRRRMQNGWGGRIFDQIQDDLQRYTSSLSLSNMALSRLSQGILKLSGMAELLTNDFGEEQVQKRLQLIDMARHLLNTIALDEDDEYDQKNLTLTGVKDILEKFENALSAATDIPATVLFGKSPDGLNSTGHSDFENFYNMVGRVQKRTLKPHLSRLIHLMSLTREFRLNLPDEYTIKFNELWNQSEKEAAETKNITAQAKEHSANAAKTYVEIGALDPMEVRGKLDDGDDYEIDRSLDKIIAESVPNSE